MNISDYAKSRGVEPQAVSRYINRHSSAYEGLVAKEGRHVVLSDAAIAKLDDVYPLPKPVEVIVDHVSRDKLILAQEQIIHLQQQLADQAGLIADAKYHQLLLEQRSEELDREREAAARQREEIASLGGRIAQQDADLAQRDAEIQLLREQLETEKARRAKIEHAGLLDRIFKTWD